MGSSAHLRRKAAASMRMRRRKAAGGSPVPSTNWRWKWCSDRPSVAATCSTGSSSPMRRSMRRIASSTRLSMPIPPLATCPMTGQRKRGNTQAAPSGSRAKPGHDEREGYTSRSPAVEGGMARTDIAAQSQPGGRARGRVGPGPDPGSFPPAIGGGHGRIRRHVSTPVACHEPGGTTRVSGPAEWSSA